MQTKPFDDLDVDDNVKKAANDVWDRMNSMIDSKVNELKVQMTKNAGVASQKAAQDAQTQLTSALDAVDKQVSNIQQALAAISANPIFTGDAALVQQSKTLQDAITAGQSAISAQRAQVQQYGQLVGGLIQKSLMAAL